MAGLPTNTRGGFHFLKCIIALGPLAGCIEEHTRNKLRNYYSVKLFREEPSPHLQG